MNMILSDMVSPVVLGGVALAFLILVAITAFALISIILFIRRKYRQKNNNNKPPA